MAQVEKVFDCEQVFSSDEAFLPVLMTFDETSRERVIWAVSRLPDKQWTPGEPWPLPCLPIMTPDRSYDTPDRLQLGRHLL